MKISEIQNGSRVSLSRRVTFLVTDQMSLALHAIAEAKKRTVSEVVREIFADFLEKNSDELKSLENKTA